MNKNSIKELLEFGFEIKFPYKRTINSWYSDISISKFEDSYTVSPQYTTFYNIDEALDYFLDNAITSKNKGYIQGRLDKKIDLEGDYNIEHPDEELIKLFEEEGKIVDEEFKNLIFN